VAALGGAGLGFSGFYFFAGPVVSWKKGIFEPYFAERINYVNYPQTNVNVENGVGEIHVDPGTYVYLQHTLGFFLWPLDWVGFGAEVSGFGTLRAAHVQILSAKKEPRFSPRLFRVGTLLVSAVAPRTSRS
jgi:hypothetical protein